MATLLDTGLLSFFLPVFVFIFVFTLLFALLEKVKLFGENKTLNVAAALSVAAISLFTGQFVGLIAIIMPWIIFLLVVLFMIFAIFGFFNVKNEKIWDLFGHTPVFIMILIIVIVGISIVFDTTLSPYQPSNPDSVAVMSSASGTNASVLEAKTTNSRQQTIRTITNPRILGALFMLIIAATTMRYLVDKYAIEK